jgi:hypothetical protein
MFSYPEFGKCITTRIWERFCDLPLEFGIQDSRGTTRVWEMARWYLEGVYMKIIVNMTLGVEVCWFPHETQQKNKGGNFTS